MAAFRFVGKRAITNYVNLAIAETKAGTPLSRTKTEPNGCEINVAD
ncbi:hypothetical protein H5P28_03030 [Ruficoccus amylovorans]|uniref:Uncharacterized protein n=1 Tax=Ruficoccus amylovorans TaxID=1804625 RepID=A0A842HC08_9BACT|nr:hypothetical protein [Ruficoccus amylovorans]MBC2593226.1 hypothetical protein [Ruficoccus amylovorans]